MFYYIEGTVAALDKNFAAIDAGGVAFAVNTTVNTLARLRTGERARLYTYLNVGENALDLYGFYDMSEKRAFELLLGVSGVGPKAALSVLSVCTPESLALAVVTENERMLTAAPGVGKRGAQRIILELRDKIAKEMPAASFGADAAPAPVAAAGIPGKKLADITGALTVLGYAPQEITAALHGLDIESMTVEEAIKVVLKNSLK